MAEPTVKAKAPTPLPIDPDKEGAPRHRGHDRNSFIAGLCLALVINGGALLTLLWMNHHGSSRNHKTVETFVEAKLMRFGKKRDLSFLPHVQSQPKTADKPKTLKLAQDPDKPTKKEEPKRVDDLSKLADRIKNLRTDDDDRVKKEFLEEGDPLGARGGTSTDASGDPFIREIMAAILEQWTVPTMLTPGDLAKLQADACLTISDDGTLVSFRIKKPSGNSLFDGSLLSTLGAMKQMPKPHGPFARAARNGALCPTFAK